MHQLTFSIKNLSPVIVPVTLGEANVVQTREHLTGSVLLGMFAAEYIRIKRANDVKTDKMHEDQDFFNYFLGGGLVYTPAYPCDNEGKGPYLPAPLYLHHAKNDDSKLFNIIKEAVEDDTKPLGGYTIVVDGEVNRLSPTKKLHFHHRRDNRIAARSEDGGIFNYEALEAGQLFRGHIIGPEDEIKSFSDIFFKRSSSKENGGFRGRVGRSKNTQYGQVQVDFEKVEKVEFDCIELEEKVANENGLKDIYLTLESPAVLKNDCGFPEISSEQLGHYLKQVLECNIQIEKALARTEVIDNFVSVWGLKKPLDRALCAGSSFKISFPEGLNKEVYEKLKLLWQGGIGERTHEGFGRFKVNVLFPKNYQFNKKYISNQIGDEIYVKPEGSMPKQGKELIEETIRKQLYYHYETEAIKDTLKYSGSGKNVLPGNSLLGRLEVLVKAVNGSEKFSESFSKKVELIRSTARDQLKRCWKDSMNLYQLLETSSEQENLFESKLKEYPHFEDLEKLTEEIDHNLLGDSDLKDKLLKTYWLALFRRMRKLNREVK